ncbi:hypothetical protein F2Q69_00026436 [Brassica cretica]|uniref:Uncharacterized protein n=1 Tax=Brassica cretica TaxID=69181 RepID=A0A8S9SCU2_BRACR|nr:hypothetical protein F2Q69_00026436 [Brassica cretica]
MVGRVEERGELVQSLMASLESNGKSRLDLEGVNGVEACRRCKVSLFRVLWRVIAESRGGSGGLAHGRRVVVPFKDQWQVGFILKDVNKA